MYENMLAYIRRAPQVTRPNSVTHWDFRTLGHKNLDNRKRVPDSVLNYTVNAINTQHAPFLFKLYVRFPLSNDTVFYTG
jgi:hypothetical protein